MQHVEALSALDPAALEAVYALPPASDWRGEAWMRANFVMSLDGAIAGPEGLSRSLGTVTDRAAFRVARSLADVLLVGAQTIRAEDYSPSRIPVAIVTRSLDLDPSLRTFAERGPEHARPVILTTDARASQAPDWLRTVADVVGCGDVGVDLPRAVGLLVARGWTRILCEGGPVLLDGLLDHDLVDELVITIVPRLVGSDEHLVTHAGGYAAPLGFTPARVVTHDGTVLTRYLRT